MADHVQDFFAACPNMMFVAEPDGRLRHQTAALSSRFGPQLGADASLFALFDAAEHETLAAFLRGLADGNAAASCVLRTTGVDGSECSLRCVAWPGSDRAIHGQLEFASVTTTDAESASRIEHALLHAITNSLDVVVWAIDKSGKFVFHDGKALAQAGLARGQLLGLNIFDVYPPEILGPIRDALAGKPTHRDPSDVHGQHWETWNLPMTNDAGEVEYSAAVSLCVTERVMSERNLERQLDTIKRQQQSIHELSTPIINIWDRVLTVPLIGIMDSTRTDELSSRLLDDVYRFNARFVILDLTGVETIDTAIADHLLRLLGSLRLLGVEGLVTGVRPQVAQTMVGVGINFENVITLRTVREGLRHCMQALYRNER